VPFAGLPPEQDSQLYYCTDCSKTNPCTNLGPGAFALGQNGAWSCAAGVAAGTVGGSNTQIQYNNAGVFGGFTAGGDAAINVSTGAVTVTQINHITPGGVAGPHQFVTNLSSSAVPTYAQPAFSDISGTAAASQLPNPSASTLGGIESLAATAHQWINAISTSGVPSSTQPAFSDVSGAIGILNRASGNPAVDLVNSAAETSVYSFAIPGNTIGINQAVRLTLLGDFLNNTGGNQTFLIKVKFGGTTVLTTPNTLTLTTSANRPTSNLSVLIQNLGATNSQLANGSFMSGPGGNGVMGNPLVDVGEFQGLAIDTTVNQTLQVTVTLGAANAALEYRLFGAVLELL
jgi:hypothetical protein